MINLGKLITLEGGEGVGKTTNLQFIQQYLENQRLNVIVTREPGGTPFAEQLRHLLLNEFSETIDNKTELLLMFAARNQHLTQVIQPALQRGDWVLSDRFTDATYAYQGGGRGIDITTIAWLEQFVQTELRPDLTLLLDAPVEIGLQRAQKRGNLDRIENEQLIFFQKVRDMYLQQAKRYPQRIKIIDASQTLTEVQYQIQYNLQELIYA